MREYLRIEREVICPSRPQWGLLVSKEQELTAELMDLGFEQVNWRTGDGEGVREGTDTHPFSEATAVTAS